MTLGAVYLICLLTSALFSPERSDAQATDRRRFVDPYRTASAPTQAAQEEPRLPTWRIGPCGADRDHVDPAHAAFHRRLQGTIRLSFFAIFANIMYSMVATQRPQLLAGHGSHGPSKYRYRSGFSIAHLLGPQCAIAYFQHTGKSGGQK